MVEFPSEIGIVFGNEALGVVLEALETCDDLVEIPMYGFKVIGTMEKIGKLFRQEQELRANGTIPF